MSEEANKDLIFRVFKALNYEEDEAKEIINQMASEEEIYEISENIRDLFIELAEEFEYVPLSDVDEIAAETAAERASEKEEAYD